MLIEPTVNRLPASRATRLGELCRKGQAFVAAGADVLTREHEHIGERLPSTRRSDLNRILAVDTYYGLPNQLLRKVDLASMYNSLEVRVPFLDTAVVEYALGLPTDYKITARKRKRILKHAFADLLPQAVLDKSKQGFEILIDNWFKNELAAEFHETIAKSIAPFIDTRAVLELHDQHSNGHRNHEWFLRNVYVYPIGIGEWSQTGICLSEELGD